jgi:CRP/FNR family transcriptional regulator, dissimilatory nitrate respiration regulator
VLEMYNKHNMLAREARHAEKHSAKPVSENVINKINIISVLPPELKAPLVSKMHVIELNRGERLVNFDDSVENFYIVLSGWVKVNRDTQEGMESSYDMLREMNTIGNRALISGGKECYDYSAYVVSHTAEIVSIPLSIMRMVVTSNSNSMRVLANMLAENISRLRNHGEMLSTMTAEQRVVKFLLSLNKKDGTEFLLPIDKSVIASHLGMKPETLSRTFSALKGENIHISAMRVTINNSAELRAKYLLEEFSI